MKRILTLVAIASLMFSCSEKTPVPETEKIPINISVGLQTRANDSAFETEDEIGLYVVNYDSATAGTLKLEGNQADNTQFTFDGSKWNSTEDIYWKDQNTPADFYAYYPYSATIASIEEYPFSVQTDQSVEGNFWASDFLWGKSAKVSPTPLAIPIKTNHIFSRAVIDIKPGNGFTEDAWNAATKSISIQEVKISATIDLSTGVATATGDAGEIVPFTTSKTGTTITYKAMIVPQEVADNSKLIVITVDGTDYVYRKGFTFKANTEHSFSITVNKIEGSVDMSIGEWTIDENLNEGEAVEENVGEIPDNEIWYTATSKVSPKRDYGFGANVVSNEWDESTGKGVITFDGEVTDIGTEAFNGKSALESIVLPNSVSYIGKVAFEECTGLKSINIPTSVTTISDEAFLGSGIESVYITDIAAWCNISFGDLANPLAGASLYLNGELLTDLVIPEGVTSIKSESFYQCKSIKSISFPNSITSIGNRAFCGCNNLESVVIPTGVSSIGDEAFLLCNNIASVTISESVTTIGYRAFNCGSKLSNIYCKPMTPPNVNVNTDGKWWGFQDITPISAKLYVPIGAGDTYKTTDYWKDYASIIEEKDM